MTQVHREANDVVMVTPSVHKIDGIVRIMSDQPYVSPKVTDEVEDQVR